MTNQAIGKTVKSIKRLENPIGWELKMTDGTSLMFDASGHDVWMVFRPKRKQKQNP